MITTFRRDGTPVATPVCAARQGDRLYVRSERACGKVKRLRHNPSVLVAPCSFAGRWSGTETPGTGRVLSSEEEYRAEQLLAQHYRWGRALFERFADLCRIDMCYIEVSLDQPIVS
jgi:PPOX class probable F420-dependent enzyme